MNVKSIRSSESSYPSRDPRYFSQASTSMGVAPPPTSKVLVDGYRNILDPVEDEAPRFNPLNYSHPRSSVLLHADDPVAMHLLTETALGDSLNFEVLSFEEVEELKKELSLLMNRIGASKRKLALEMKLKEAAVSLSRLSDTNGRRESSEEDPESSPKSHRRRPSFFGRHSGIHHRSDDELAISTHKCEELAQELWRLEQRASELRRRILEHTAGILQMTHKGLKKKSATNQQNLQNGGSYGDGRADTGEFDERSLYKTADYLDDIGGGHTLRNGPSAVAGEGLSVNVAGLHETKRRLDELNGRLRDMILQANPQQDVDPIPQDLSNGTATDPIKAVQTSLDYLDKGLQSMASSHINVRQGEETPGAGEKLAAYNKRLDHILVEAGSTRPQISPHASMVRTTLAEHLDYLGDIVDDAQVRVENLTNQKTILTTQIQQQRELNSKSDAERDAHIGDLVEQIALLKKDLEVSQKEASSTRDELTMVMDQLDASRQESMIREQRQSSDNANSEKLAAKETEIAKLEEELQRLLSERVTHQNAEMDLANKENEIAMLQGELRQLDSERESRQRSEQELAAKEGEITRLEDELRHFRSENDDELRKALEEKEKSDTELKRIQSDHAELESEMIRLQTDLTIVRAELDGAYGSRSQRAAEAEAAVNPAIQKELDELAERNMSLMEELAVFKAEQLNNSNSQSTALQDRVQMLEKELRETIDDYEAMTKSSIEFEKERDKLESVIDSYRDRAERLEAQLNEERIQALGTNGARDGIPADTTSTTVLKNEFKKMMRDSRAESLKMLKAEQEERRRLEGLIRTLKKEQSAGKSNLSQSTIAS